MDTVDHACETLDLAWRLLRLNGLGASDLVRLSSAHTNDVYRADEAYVVRICRTPGSEHRLRAEAELLRRIRDTVPVQPVVACGVVDGAAYQILGYIEGQSLSRCWHTLSRAGIESMARDLAAHLRSLHALTQDGFGYFSVPAVTGTTWRDFILGMFGQLRDGILQGPVDACVSEALDEAGRYLRIHAGCLDGGGSARTIHNDLWFSNILVRDGRLTGFVDFEFAERAPVDKELYKIELFCRMPEVFEEQGDFSSFIPALKTSYPEMFEHPELSTRLSVYDLLVFWKSHRHDVAAGRIGESDVPARAIAVTNDIVSGRMARLV